MLCSVSEVTGVPPCDGQLGWGALWNWRLIFPFLKGGADGQNAVALSVNATFWLETLQGQSAPTQLQYAQTVLLNFNTLSWPHITVATLHKS